MSTISSSGTLTYSSGTFSYTGSFSSGNANTWPITVSASVTVTFGSTLTMSATTNYFLIGGSSVTIDGGNYTVSLTAGNTYLGLLQNGTSSTNGYASCAVKNIVVVNSSSIYGLIAQSYFCNGQTSCSITNCSAFTPVALYYNEGPISSYNNYATITNCFAVLNSYVYPGGGGIVGNSNQSSGTITNCYTIISTSSGGMGGGIAGINNRASISGCFSIHGGDIGTNTSGGITGTNNTGAITNCYTIIGGTVYQGGIVGTNNTGAISNCYAIIKTINSDGGGIAGDSNNGTITNCYVNYGGTATNIFSSSGTKTNCSSANSATWSSTGANWALNSYNSGAAWYNYDSNNLTPYVLSAFSTAVSSSQSVSTSPGTLASTSYGSGLSTGIVSSTTGGTWSFSSSGVGYSGILKASYPLVIFAYNVLSNLTSFSFTFLYPSAINTAYNSSAASVYTIVPYIYSYTSDVIVTSTVCFLEGSEILTKRGYVKIEEMERDDLVLTCLHGYKNIYNIVKSEMINVGIEERIKDQLYVCKKEKFEGVTKDLVMTGCHSILVDSFENEEQREETIKILGRIFVTDEKYRLPTCIDSRSEVYQEKGLKKIYHITLENEDDLLSYGIYANGLLVESCSKFIMNKIMMKEMM